MLPLLAGCPLLKQPADLWSDAGDLGYALRVRGVTAKSLDLLIATYALSHAVPILTRDKDFGHIQKAGTPLLLVEAGR